MKTFLLPLLLLGAFVFSTSMVVPVDESDTAYDESEQLPFMSAAYSAIKPLEDSARLSQT
jgi:hypothetical protein